MKKISSIHNIKKIFHLSHIFLISGIFGYANIAYADVNGIPYNSEFPKAQYPYAQAPDACSGYFSNADVRDTWGPVDFRGACNTHDKCYYTLGSNWNTCNERFYSDLRAACERDLRISTPLGKLPPDPVKLSACYQIATTYYAGVQAGVALEVFKDAQNKQKKYEKWVANVRNLARSPVFDANFYLTFYEDLRSVFGSNQESARNHWLSNGIKEGRRSSLVFDVQYYLGRYPDLQNAFGRNNYAAAINHWLSNGIGEGRQGSADFDPRYYLSNNPDVTKAFGANNYQGAITHYLTNGRNEGRRGTPSETPKWAMVAKSNSTNNIGYSFQLEDQQQSRDRAVETCSAPDCVLVTEIKDGYVAVGNDAGVAWGYSAQEAKDKVVAQCRANNPGLNCVVYSLIGAQEGRMQ
jgi:hypothetical protein